MIQVGFIELPGSVKVFDLGRRVWDTRGEDQDPHVPLLTISGRIGAVSAKSEQAEAALQLLFWLSSDQLSPQVSATSPATTLFRRTQVRSPRPWVERQASSAAAAQYAEAAERTFRRREWLAALPIAGRVEYLAALDKAVHEAISGKQIPMIALLDASREWSRITEARGVEHQRAAYLHSLGMVD